MSNFQQVKNSFNYQAESPKTIEINSRNSDDWIRNIEKTIGQVKVQLMVLVIPGPKGKNPLYSDLKKHFTCNYPIPCQCIISGTLMKGKILLKFILYFFT